MHPALRKDVVAVITGAAAGIGFAIAERMAQQQMKLVLLDWQAPVLAQAVSRIRARYPDVTIHTVVGDIAHDAVCEQLYEIAIATGEIGLLVNNAAIGTGAGPWADVSQWRSLMDINFWALLRLQTLFMQTLSQQTGHSAIVNLGSKEGITTPPGNAAYAVSKAAVRILTEQLAHELREQFGNRISAHLLIPGYTFTPMNFPGITPDSVKPREPWSAAQVAHRMVDGMNAGDFYIFCEDNEVTRELDKRRMQWSMDDLIQNRPALSRWHPDWCQNFADYIRGA